MKSSRGFKRMLSTFIICALAYIANAHEDEQLELPMGNLGLNYACNEIENANAKMKEDTGISFFFDYYAVLLSNPYGGAGQATNYTHEMLYGLDFDMEKIASWKGASLRVSGAYNAGGNLSNTIGNFFTVSESSVTNGVMFYEIYLSQNIQTAYGDLDVYIGRISMSDIFGNLPAAGYLVSGGMDVTPEAILFNSPFTSSPIATWGIAGELATIEDLTFAAGIYQIPQNVESANWDGVNWKINSEDGYMAIFQAQWSPTFYEKTDSKGNVIANSGLDGIYQVGGYFYGGFNPQIFGSSDRSNAYGFYLQGQQMIWRSSAETYISMWAGVQYAPVQSICPMTWMAYSGFQFQGFIPERINDGIFVSWLAGWFSEDYTTASGISATYENVIEITYVFQINNNISIQPDIQYIMRPNGDDSIDDALVIGGQVVVSF